MIVFAVSGYRSIRARARRLWWWATLHPKTAMVLALGICWLVSAIVAVPAAYADGSANSSAPPYFPPTDLKDSEGVPLWRYTILPLDRGDVWHPGKTVISNIVDGIWVINLASFSWCLWLLAFLLEFTWVDWIATPIGTIAETIHSILSQFGWAPFALAVAGLVFGCAVAFGKFARGAVDAGVSILCFVLATGALANPVATLTGDNGILTKTESVGANLSVSVMSDKGDLPTGTPTKDEAQDLISQSLMGGLIDVFVRIPAQEIAFGHALSGQCDTTFSEQMKKATVFNTDSNAVRDAVGKCDSAAQEYVTHPNPGQVATALSVTGGSGVLMLIALAMAMITLMAVLYALVNAIKLSVNVYLGMLPGVAREALWRSLFGMYVGAITLGMAVVMLAGYLVVLAGLMKAVSDAGLTIVAQTTIIDIVVIALIITLFWMFIANRRSGKRAAKWLATLGNRFGARERQQMSPLTARALTEAGRYGLDQFRNRKKPTPAEKAVPAARNIGNLTATPTSSRAATTAGRAIKAASTVGQVAAAASTGGASAAAIKATQIGGKKVLQRHLLNAGGSAAGKALNVGGSAAGKALNVGGSVAGKALTKTPNGKPTAQTSAGYASSAASMPFGRQIVVDKGGVGRIAPAEQNTSGVYRITRAPQARVAQSPIRAALERAAKKSTEAA